MCDSSLILSDVYWLQLSLTTQPLFSLVVIFSYSVVSDSFATPWTVACQCLLSMGFPRQEYWNGLPFPSPGDLPDPGLEPIPPALEGGFFTTKSPELYIYFGRNTTELKCHFSTL